MGTVIKKKKKGYGGQFCLCYFDPLNINNGKYFEINGFILFFHPSKEHVCISVFSLSMEDIISYFIKCSFVNETSQPLLTLRVYLIWICAPRIIVLASD
jgi:hypothetical protein